MNYDAIFAFLQDSAILAVKLFAIFVLLELRDLVKAKTVRELATSKSILSDVGRNDEADGIKLPKS